MNLSTAESIFRRHAECYLEAYCYGSVVRGDEDGYSDLDVLVVRETEALLFDRMREIMDLRCEFGGVDMWIYTPSELKEMLAGSGYQFVKDIVATGYRIEGKQERSPQVAPPG